jgi:hypothetical protein
MSGDTGVPKQSGVMEGGGFYAAHSVTQHGAGALGLPLVGRAVDALDIDGMTPPVLVADLGAAQGGNSLEPMRAVLDALTGQGVAHPVCVVHTDLADNDFATLFRLVESSPDSYLRGHPNAYPLVAGRSFYDRIFPSASLTLAWTSATLHWLRRAPGPVPDHFFVQQSRDHDARRAYAQQSQRDWLDFLSARATELVPDGGIVVVDVLMGDDGSMGSEALFDAVEAGLAAARDAGVISADERARTAYPTWFRSLDELRAPFAPRFVAPTGEQLELAELTPAILDDPFADLLHTGDADGYAAAQVGFLRGFLDPSFAAALDDSRPDEDRSAALDVVWSITRAAIAAAPQAMSPAYRLVTARIRRIGEQES